MITMPPYSEYGGFQGGSDHAVVRTTELLSCARTALRIAQQQSQQGLLRLPDDLLALNPNNLVMYNVSHSVHSPDYLDDILPNTAADLVRESQSLLVLLDSQLEKMSALVKRRGQTNDPTTEINALMAEFNAYTKDLMEIIQKSLGKAATMPFRHGIQSSQHRVKHFQIIANTIQLQVENRMRSFKDIMAMRGDAIQELSQRRRRLLEGTGSNINSHNPTTLSSTSNTAQSFVQNTPLFTITDTATSRNGYGITPSSHIHNFNTQPKSETTMNPYYSNQHTNGPTVSKTLGYGGYPHGHALYGGGDSSNLYSTGIRRRGLHPSSETTSTGSAYYYQTSTSSSVTELDDEDKKKNKDNTTFMKSQLQMRKESRQKQSRLESAREAEKSLAELSTMFQKMSSLIHSQGEVLTKVEDDVEAAFVEVNAGAEEITKLYHITKGNRGLIIKVFSLLIFFIIVMRFFRS